MEASGASGSTHLPETKDQTSGMEGGMEGGVGGGPAKPVQKVKYGLMRETERA